MMVLSQCNRFRHEANHCVEGVWCGLGLNSMQLALHPRLSVFGQSLQIS